MPYDVKGLNRLCNIGTSGSGANPSIWTYVTADAHATVAAANYFNSQAAFMQVGDLIDAITGFGGTPVNRRYVVTANTGSVVTITAVTGASWT